MTPDPAAEHARRWRALWPALGADAPRQLEDLLAELARWNRRIRLTAPAPPEELARRVVDDSLVLAPFVLGPSLLDVGSGAGLPSLPLAIARPELEVRPVEPIAKKTAFIRAFAARHPALKVRVVTGRAGEGGAPLEPASTVVSRAFEAPAEWVRTGAPLAAPGGRLLVLLGAERVDGPVAAAADAAARAQGLRPAGRWSGRVGEARRGLLWYDRPTAVPRGTEAPRAPRA